MSSERCAVLRREVLVRPTEWESNMGKEEVIHILYRKLLFINILPRFNRLTLQQKMLLFTDVTVLSLSESVALSDGCLIATLILSFLKNPTLFKRCVLVAMET